MYDAPVVLLGEKAWVKLVSKIVARSQDELVNVSDETYEKLVTNEKRLQNWGVANEKILLEVCEK